MRQSTTMDRPAKKRPGQQDRDEERDDREAIAGGDDDLAEDDLDDEEDLEDEADEDDM